MWIVKLALRRPYTFLVLAILITLLGVFSIIRTPTDIFPDIKIPVVAVIWRYTGLRPRRWRRGWCSQRAHRPDHRQRRRAHRVAVAQRHLGGQDTSSSRAPIRTLSMAQITAVSQTELAMLPPGTTPPFILAYNASSVPILQLALSSDTLIRSAALRPGQQLMRTGTRRPCRAPSLPYPVRRQAAPGAGGSGSGGPARAGSVRRTTSWPPSASQNSDPAGRHAEDRRPRVLRPAQFQPAQVPKT